jgi:hypothetical protein
VSPTEPPDDEPMFDPRITSYPWPLGILAGAFTFMIGYLAMGIVIIANNGIDALTETPQRVIIDVGLTFYSAQQVVANVEFVEQIANPGALPTTFDMLAGSTDIPKIIYYAVPVVVLLVLAGAVAQKTLSDETTLEEAVLPAIGVSLGYTVMAGLGTFIVRADRFDGAVQLVPDLTQTLIFGLAYSLTCAVVASAAVIAWRHRDDPDAMLPS